MARYREQLGRVAEMIAERIEEVGIYRCLCRPTQMAIAVEALSQGIELQRLADPDSVPDDLLGRLYALLFQLPAEGESTQ